MDGPAAALVDELGMVEKTGCDPVAASRFSHVTEVKVSSSASIVKAVAAAADPDHQGQSVELAVKEGALLKSQVLNFEVLRLPTLSLLIPALAQLLALHELT